MAEEELEVDVSTLADEWDAIREIRDLLRNSGSVAKNDPGKYCPSDGVEGVGNNIALLSPVVKMLRLPGQHPQGRPRIGMVSIPALQEELPACE